MRLKFSDSEKLYCFYDFAVSPASYDFFSFLFSAEICRVRRGLKKIDLVLVQGNVNKFRGDDLRTSEICETFLHNVIIPGLSILPSLDCYFWVSRDNLTIKNIKKENLFPRGYTLNKPKGEYLSHELVAAKVRGDQHSGFTAPAFANSLVQDFISARIGKNPFITLTAREDSRGDHKVRTINKDLWGSILRKIKKQGVTPIIVRDTSNAFDQPMFDDIIEASTASVHLPFRLALYENAICNFTRNNGPSVLQLFGTSNIYYIAEFTDSKNFLHSDWWKDHYGMTHNSQFPMTTDRAKIIWGPENSDYIIEAVKQKNNLHSQSDDLYGFSSKENALESCRVAFRHFMKCVQFDLLHEDAGLLMGIKRLNEEYQLGFDLELTITEKEGKEIPKGTIARLKKYFGLQL